MLIYWRVSYFTSLIFLASDDFHPIPISPSPREVVFDLPHIFGDFPRTPYDLRVSYVRSFPPAVGFVGNGSKEISSRKQTVTLW